MPRLAYARQVIQESMRLYPPAWMIARSPIEDDRIGDYGLPAKSLVFMSAYITQRDPSPWENPTVFDPARFAQGHAPEPKDFRYFPFGGGPRICIGNQFAMMEAQIVLALLVRDFDLRADLSRPVVLDPLITLRPKGGLLGTVSSRA